MSDAAAILVSFHYLNRVLNALGPEGPLLDSMARSPRSMVALGLKVGRSMPPGAALARLRASGLDLQIEVHPADRAHIERWSLGRRPVADAMLQAWSLIQDAAQEVLDESVIETIRGHLSRWRGQDAALGDPWLEEAVAGLAHDPEAQDLARQGLRVAREPFRIDRDALWRACGGDRRLQLVLVGFAACAAALQIGANLTIPRPLEICFPRRQHQIPPPLDTWG